MQFGDIHIHQVSHCGNTYLEAMGQPQADSRKKRLRTYEYALDVHDVLHRVEKGAGWVCKKSSALFQESQWFQEERLFCFSKIF